MSFEEEFSHALREAATDSPPVAVDLLALGAAERGQRRKRRRTVLASAATVALLAGVGALTLQPRPSAEAAGPSADGRGAPTVSAAASGSPTTTPSPSAPSPSTPSPSATAPVSAEQLLELFKTKLPGGLQLSDPMARDNVDGVSNRFAALTVTDGRGSSSVEITIQHAPPWPNPTKPPIGNCLTTDPDCVGTAQPGGAYLLAYHPPRAAGGAQQWSAMFDRPDGARVIVDESDVPGPGTGRTEPYANALLLSPEQLSALALDPVWAPLAVGLPTPWASPK
ncbi:hypothetical protein OG455_30830 [Kitasatospora sp. NBC_01287]|uniref:hypothetical protein n=1 Tax=Kitasatospora sp. NBC_01287 TaxID=2903573 RepID=UPI0022520A04|nr:hypothetical protein [Kitasatospora sp. NBC_01287]MCX4749860.1 hypothetical protein [Kitasatospora sp. NBC_01287]